MTVVGSQGLEYAARDVEAAIDLLNAKRSHLHLPTFDTPIKLAWYDAEPPGMIMPVLWMDESGHDLETLRSYFSNAHHAGFDDNEAHELLRNRHVNVDDVTDDPALQTLARAARHAIRSYDECAIVRGLDFALLSEQHQHETSAFTQTFESTLAEYRNAVFSHKNSDILIDYAIEIAAERVKREIIRGMRTGIVGYSLGGTKTETFSLHSIGQIASELSTILDEDIESSHTILEARDGLVEIVDPFLKTTRKRVNKALDKHPERFAYADEHARSADEWLRALR